ncbi:MAG: hypothetical protein IKE28_06750 [Solobacterium sp.]|nr:hypothetical protein [Solobacterium sp.]
MNRKQTPAVFAAFCALLFGACVSALKCSDTKDGITVELNNAVFTNNGIETVTPDITITNSSQEDITGVTYEVTFFGDQETELETIRMFWRCDEEPLKAGSSIRDKDSRYNSHDAKQAKSVKLVITEIKTAKEFPPDRVPKKGEYLYQAMGDEKLAAIQEHKPEKIVAGIDQSGYVRTATFEGDLLDEAVDAFVKIRLGDDDAPMVTDNYNYVVFYWDDGTTSGINLNLQNLEVMANGRYHSYYLEDLGPFWGLVNDHLVDPEPSEEDLQVSCELNHVKAVLADVVYRESDGTILPEPYVKFANESKTEYLGVIYEIEYYDANNSLLGRQLAFTDESAPYSAGETWEERPKEKRPQMKEMPASTSIRILDTIGGSTTPSLKQTDAEYLYQKIDNEQIQSLPKTVPVLTDITVDSDSNSFNAVFFDVNGKDIAEAFTGIKIRSDAEEAEETSYKSIMMTFEDGEEIHLNIVNGCLIALQDGEVVKIGIGDENGFFELAEETGS